MQKLLQTKIYFNRDFGGDKIVLHQDDTLTPKNPKA